MEKSISHFQTWQDVSDLISRNSSKLNDLRNDSVFVSFGHVGTIDCEGGYGWKMVMRITAEVVDDVCRKCGYNPRTVSNENKYRDAIGIPNNHRHSWSRKSNKIGSVVTDEIEKAEQFINSL